MIKKGKKAFNLLQKTLITYKKEGLNSVIDKTKKYMKNRKEIKHKNNYKDILTEEDIGSLFSESEFKQQVENISEIRLNINIIWIISSIVLIFLTVFALYKKYV